MRQARTDYSPAAKALHWIIAVIVIGLIPVGIVMGDLPRGALQDRLFILHESFGLTVFALMFLRIAVRLQGAPAPDATLPRAEQIMSRAIHHTLYLLLFVTPLLGWLALSAYGLGPSYFSFGQLPALLSKDEPLSKTLFTLHGVGGFLIGGLVLLHIAGVMRHTFSKRSDVVSRMLWRGQSS